MDAHHECKNDKLHHGERVRLYMKCNVCGDMISNGACRSLQFFHLNLFTTEKRKIKNNVTTMSCLVWCQAVGSGIFNIISPESVKIQLWKKLVNNVEDMSSKYLIFLIQRIITHVQNHKNRPCFLLAASNQQKIYKIKILGCMPSFYSFTF